MLSTSQEGAQNQRLVSDSDREVAEKLKAAANDLFAAGKYLEATDKYTEAIHVDPHNPIYFSNRALANHKQELYGAAIVDATAAISIDPSGKAYYRRAMAHTMMGDMVGTIADLKNSIRLDPSNKDARAKLQAAIKEKMARAFAEAIAVDHVTALQELGDIDAIIVEDSYDGPKLVDANTISLEFVVEMLAWMKVQKKLHRKYALQIMVAVRAIFYASPTIVDIPIPETSKITVNGDIHGQFYDLLHVFDLNGLPSPTNMYLWNGDFVDRGSFSVECILTLFAFKWLYPDAVHLTRGNHETDGMNRTYGFEGEVKHKYSEVMFRFFSDIFNGIPLGNLIGEKILVVHGGLFSRDDVTMDEIRKIDRFRQPSPTGNVLMTEILWSDPQDENGRSPSQRGCGIRFGPDITADFLSRNNLSMVIRSHEVKQQGYEIQHNGKLVTIFSAPNYCDNVNNLGAYIHINSKLETTFHQFQAVPHPPVAAMRYASKLYGGQS